MTKSVIRYWTSYLNCLRRRFELCSKRQTSFRSLQTRNWCVDSPKSARICAESTINLHANKVIRVPTDACFWIFCLIPAISVNLLQPFQTSFGKPERPRKGLWP